MSILNKYKRHQKLLGLNTSETYDVVLSQDTTKSVMIDSKLTLDGLISYINFSDEDCIIDNNTYISSEFKWHDAINNGVVLNDIGFTGIDNGLINFDCDKITTEEYKYILSGSTYSIIQNDTHLKLNKVYSNSKYYDYSIEQEDGYISLKGGFLQGFFKLEGFDYKILPDVFDKDIHFEFVLRPREYNIKKNTLNNINIHNNGIFFYIGTRAENKFAFIYNKEFENNFPNRKITYNRCDDYFLEGYLQQNESATTKDDTIISGITNDILVDSEGNSIRKYPISEIQTDNKYLFFNHTPSGFTTDTWDSTNEIVLQWENYNSQDNLYLTVNNTISGKTANDIKQEVKHNNKKYNIYKDLINNAFALKINDDMSIGYRYLIKDCTSENGYSIIEEQSFPNIIEFDKWNIINIRFKPLNNIECDTPLEKCKMKIMIYINGYLKFISQELPIFNFKALDDQYNRQECVPYSISIGGGTQGLCDSLWDDYKHPFNKVLPLEKNFAGTFIGDIKSFKIYEGIMEYAKIKNNALFEEKSIE